MKIAIIGTGQMGKRVAEAAAISGFDVYLIGSAPSRSLDACIDLDRSINQLAEKGKIPRKLAERSLLRLHSLPHPPEQTWEQFEAVVEAVTEDIDIKKSVLAQIGPSPWIFTNTSSLSITELAQSCLDPSRVVGTHFLLSSNKVDRIVRGDLTSDRAVAKAQSFSAMLWR